MTYTLRAGLVLGVALVTTPTSTPAQTTTPRPSHTMTTTSLGSGWSAMGMAQMIGVATGGKPLHRTAPLDRTELYLTQPALMVNIASPGLRWVLRTTVDAEVWTQPNGELTYGGWGEGFIDKRHPHTLLHEATLSYNGWNAAGGSMSLTAGKGFAPYGTDDPMSRPVVKFPINHHLSQVLERFTANAVWLHRSGLSVEVGVFGGSEPTGPYDFSNIESFGNSFSTRITQRLGDGFGPAAQWEISGSYARIEEEHHAATEVTHLLNAAVRHEQRYATADLYALLEGSRSEIAGPEKGYWSVLAETRLGFGGAMRRHRPYARVEVATRPEYEREGAIGTEDFYRYDHDHADLLGATRWVSASVGYAVALGRDPVAVQPFVELQHHVVRNERGSVAPKSLFGRDAFWSASAGVRLHLGGSSMRMGSYGVLDAMSASMRPATPMHGDPGGSHAGH